LIYREADEKSSDAVSVDWPNIQPVAVFACVLAVFAHITVRFKDIVETIITKQVKGD